MRGKNFKQIFFFLNKFLFKYFHSRNPLKFLTRWKINFILTIRKLWWKKLRRWKTFQRLPLETFPFTPYNNRKFFYIQHTTKLLIYDICIGRLVESRWFDKHCEPSTFSRWFSGSKWPRVCYFKELNELLLIAKASL